MIMHIADLGLLLHHCTGSITLGDDKHLLLNFTSSLAKCDLESSNVELGERFVLLASDRFAIVEGLAEHVPRKVELGMIIFVAVSLERVRYSRARLILAVLADELLHAVPRAVDHGLFDLPLFVCDPGHMRRRSRELRSTPAAWMRCARCSFVVGARADVGVELHFLL